MKLRKLIIFVLIILLIIPSFFIPKPARAAANTWWDTATVTLNQIKNTNGAISPLVLQINLNPSNDSLRPEDLAFRFSINSVIMKDDILINNQPQHTTGAGLSHFIRPARDYREHTGTECSAPELEGQNGVYLVHQLHDNWDKPSSSRFSVEYVANDQFKFTDNTPANGNTYNFEIFGADSCHGRASDYLKIKNQVSFDLNISDPGSEESQILALKKIDRTYDELRNLISGNCGLNPEATIIKDPSQAVNPLFQPVTQKCDANGQNNGGKNPFWTETSELGLIWSQLLKNMLSKAGEGIFEGVFGVSIDLESQIYQTIFLTDAGKSRVEEIDSKAKDLVNQITELDEQGITEETYQKAKILRRYWEYKKDCNQARVDSKKESSCTSPVYFESWEAFKTRFQKMIDLYKSSMEIFLENQDPCESNFLTALVKRNLAGFMICIVGQFVDNLATFIMEIGLRWIRNGAGL